jgi:hypothetical protein
MALLFLVVFNGFYFLLVYLNDSFDQVNYVNQMVLLVIQPFFLSSILTLNFRTCTLYINDYHTITDFAQKLNSKIIKENMRVESDSEQKTVYYPETRFSKLFNHWRGAEKVTVTWGEELSVHGSGKKISDLEDFLMWNKDFKR